MYAVMERFPGWRAEAHDLPRLVSYFTRHPADFWQQVDDRTAQAAEATLQAAEKAALVVDEEDWDRPEPPEVAPALFPQQQAQAKLVDAWEKNLLTADFAKNLKAENPALGLTYDDLGKYYGWFIDQ